jgi:pimeloyl-[acyl-carrier protein] synthase
MGGTADASADPALSLFQLLDPAVHADPYPFYRTLRERSPVHWDPFMHTWVVTRYEDVMTVLQRFSADRTPDPQAMTKLGLPSLGPVAEVMAKQMLFLDAPDHTRLRKLCSTAFTPRRVEAMEEQILDIARRLIDDVIAAGKMDVIADFAETFPAIVTAGLLGVPLEDHRQLKAWSADFAEMLGNFQHNPDRIHKVLASTADMTAYFRDAIRSQAHTPRDGLIRSLMLAEIDGTRLSEDEVIANTIVTMVGGQETTTNLIGNGLLTLIHQPDRMAELRDDPALMTTGIEELLRYESPSQHTARIAPEDTMIGGRMIPKGAAVMAVMAAGNRDPERFPDPDRLDLARADNRHLAFGWSAHFCFGAPLARMEARIAFKALLGRLRNVSLATDKLEWRTNSGLRGLKSLPVTFTPA